MGRACSGSSASTLGVSSPARSHVGSPKQSQTSPACSRVYGYLTRELLGGEYRARASSQPDRWEGMWLRSPGGYDTESDDLFNDVIDRVKRSSRYASGHAFGVGLVLLNGG